MSPLLIACAVLAACSPLAVSDDNVNYTSPDLVTIVPTEIGGFMLEAFKATPRGGRGPREPYWVSVGRPKLMPPPSSVSESGERLGVFLFDGHRVSIWMTFLTQELRQTLVGVARSVYNTSVDEKQIKMLPLSHVNCSIKMYSNDGTMLVLHGSATTAVPLATDGGPLCVSFMAPKSRKETEELRQRAVQENDNSVVVKCRLRVRGKNSQEKPVQIPSATIDRLGLIGKIFGTQSNVTMTRTQMGALADEVYLYLSAMDERRETADDFRMPSFEFAEALVEGILLQERMETMEVDKALQSLSGYGSESRLEPARIRADLDSLLRVGGASRVVVNDEVLRDPTVVIPSPETPGVYDLHRVIRVGYLEDKVAEGRKTEDQVAALNSDDSSDVLWTVDGNRVLAERIRVARLSKVHFGGGLSLPRFSRPSGYLPYSREVALSANSLDQIDSSRAPVSSDFSSLLSVRVANITDEVTRLSDNLRNDLNATFDKALKDSQLQTSLDQLDKLEEAEKKMQSTLEGLLKDIRKLHPAGTSAAGTRRRIET